jgi:hypothetical protein
MNSKSGTQLGLECLKGQQNSRFRLINRQSSCGNQKKQCHVYGLLQGAVGHPHSSAIFLKNTYLLESDEFAYAPIEQLICDRLSSRRPPSQRALSRAFEEEAALNRALDETICSGTSGKDCRAAEMLIQ